MFKQMFNSVIIPMAISVGMGILKSLTAALWDSLWAAIFQGVYYAERKWIESGRGKLRQRYVVEKIMAFLEEKKLIKWGTGWLVKIFLEELIVDRILKELNDELGHDWVKKVTDLKLWFETKYNLEEWVGK